MCFSFVFCLQQSYREDSMSRNNHKGPIITTCLYCPACLVHCKLKTGCDSVKILQIKISIFVLTVSQVDALNSEEEEEEEDRQSCRPAGHNDR